MDGELLLDFPCDTFWQAITYGIDLSQIKHILITHAHSDHFYPTDMGYTRKFFGTFPADFEPITIHGNQEVGDGMQVDENGFMFPDGRTRFSLVKAFQPFRAGSFLATPLPACHDTKEPLIYLLQKEGELSFIRP